MVHWSQTLRMDPPAVRRSAEPRHSRNGLHTSSERASKSRRHLPEKSDNLFFRPLQVRVDLVQSARWLVLEEISVEVNLIADLVLAAVHPSIGKMGLYFADEIV